MEGIMQANNLPESVKGANCRSENLVGVWGVEGKLDY